MPSCRSLVSGKRHERHEAAPTGGQCSLLPTSMMIVFTCMMHTDTRYTEGVTGPLPPGARLEYLWRSTINRRAAAAGRRRCSSVLVLPVSSALSPSDGTEISRCCLAPAPAPCAVVAPEGRGAGGAVRVRRTMRTSRRAATDACATGHVQRLQVATLLRGGRRHPTSDSLSCQSAE